MANRIKQILVVNLEIFRKERSYILNYESIPLSIKLRLINKLRNGIYQIVEIPKPKRLREKPKGLKKQKSKG